MLCLLFYKRIQLLIKQIVNASSEGALLKCWIH